MTNSEIKDRENGHNTDMSTTAGKKFIKILPSVILLALIALLAGLSFLPSVRKASSVAVSSEDRLDAEAVRVLGCSRAYVDGHDFSTVMRGAIKAKVLGVPYTQNVTGSRRVCGDEFSDVTESVSAFIKAGIKRECVGGELFAARGDYKDKAFVYGAPARLDREKYIATYGMPATGLVKYDLDNALVSAESLGKGKYRYVLDARRATKYSRNEVKTTVGGKSYPEYESVEFTLTFDGERAVKITVKEKFRVDKFGGTHCVAQFTETFEYPQAA